MYVPITLLKSLCELSHLILGGNKEIGIVITHISNKENEFREVKWLNKSYTANKDSSQILPLGF